MKRRRVPHSATLTKRISLVEVFGKETLAGWVREKELMTAEIFAYQKLPSSQTLMSEHALEDFNSGDVVLVREQLAGHGRYARIWHSTPGVSLTFSILLTLLGEQEQEIYVYLSALAIVRAFRILREQKNVTQAFACTIKWPNDVLVNGRKIAGILIKRLLRGAESPSLVIGVGINVGTSLADLRGYVVKEEKYGATSFFYETGVPCSLEEVLERWLSEFFTLETIWDSGERELIYREWRECNQPIM